VNDNGKMSGNSWVILQCLAILTVFGVLSFFRMPEYGLGVGLIIGAVIAMLNNAAGVKSGGKLPEQVGSPQAGQDSQTQITSTVSTQSPPAPLLPNPQPGDPHNPL
jgi:hypothetical protein